MVANSKILTVAYGTFSCTLEGFDDPFSAMKDIAEYFRDLAAEDRFFGAEPPSPDAEMLTRIAERSAKETVQAELGENSLTLRPAATAAAVAAPALEADAEDGLEGDDVVLETSEDAGDDLADTIAAALSGETEDAPAQSDVVDDETLAANDLEVHEDDFVAESDQTDGADLPGEALTLEDMIDEDVAAEDEAVADEDVLEEAVEALEEEAPEEDDLAEDIVAAAPEATEADDDVSISERLARIQEVVAEDAAEDAQDELTEDEHAEDFGRSDDAFEDDFADIEDEIEEKIEDTGSLDAFAQEIAEDEAEEEALAEAAEADLDDEDAAALEDWADDIDEDDVADARQEAADEKAEEAPKPRRPVAVVRKVRKVQPAQDAAPAASDLDPEDEAELMAELAAIEAETAPVRRAGSESLKAAVDEDADRLFNDTDKRLTVEETSRRHANIAHLKAAVAARQADRDAGADQEAADDTDAYREDLASAVKPRRPRVGTARTERPTTARPAPLVLVSEQRVDTEAETDTPAASVRPRRVTRAAAAAAAPQPAAKAEAADKEAVHTGFEDYAAEMGVTSLADILELAASYHMGASEDGAFRRHEVMRLAANTAPDFSREEGLRQFGELVREGTFEKLSRGVFRLSEDSRYYEDDQQSAAS